MNGIGIMGMNRWKCAVSWGVWKDMMSAYSGEWNGRIGGPFMVDISASNGNSYISSDIKKDTASPSVCLPQI